MVFQIFALAFVLGVAGMQSIFGLFSGMIMAFSCIVAACVALGSFEALNNIAIEYVHPSYSAAASLIVLFVVTLVILRALGDNLIRGNVRVPPYVDWGGGGVLGFVIAQICVGILALGIQMLPMGDRILGYGRFDRKEGVKEQGRDVFERPSLWLNPDGFTVGLVSLLSNGALNNDNPITSVYPDFVEWVAWTGNTVQSESDNAVARDKSGDGYRDGIRVVKWWEQTKEIEGRYRTDPPHKNDKVGKYASQTYKPEPGNKLIGVTVELKRASGDRDERGNGSQRFRPTNLRLVGRRGNDARHYYPKVMTNVDPNLKERARILDETSNIVLRTVEGDRETVQSEGTVDAYFEVDADFVPSFLEFKRFARTNMGEPAKPGDKGASASGKDAARVNPPSGGGTGNQTAQGHTRFIDYVDQSVSGENDRLPIEIKADKASSAGENPAVEGALFASGRLFGVVDDLRATGADARVEKFKLPSGFKLCQVKVQARKVSTTFAQAFNFAGRTLNQYHAVDNLGDRYDLAGYYAIVKRGDKQHFEIYYVGDDESQTTAFRHMLDWKHITGQELTADDDAVLGLLFLVKPGRTITEIGTQKEGTGITGLNLQVSP